MFDSKIWKFITNFFGFSSDNKSEQKPKVIKKKIIVFHKVNAGETLYSIAKSNGVSVEALKEANGLKGDGISAGQRLRIPSKASKTIFPVDKKSDNSGFQMYREISDEQIINANEGNKYVKIVKYPDYTIKKGETAGSVAQKFAVSSKALLSLNNLNEKSIQIGQKVKIPSKRIVRNIKNINDVSKATGLSVEYLQSLEKMEEKHNKIYKDKNGVNTIGIGHVVQDKELKKYSGKISDAQIYTLLAQDLIDREENIKAILGETSYKKLPLPLKDSVMDFVYNRGETTFENRKGLVDALKKGDYKSAISKMDTDYSVMKFDSPSKLNKYIENFKDKRCFVIEKDGKTLRKYLSGLNKRRLFEMSHASKIYKDIIPDEIINSAQNTYNRGLYFMAIETHNGLITKNAYKNIKAEYNNQANHWFNGNIKLK